MHSVGSSVCYIGEEASRELALNIEIPLLHISVLRIAVSADPEVGSQRGTAVSSHKARNVRSGQTVEVASRGSDDSRIAERTNLSTCKAVRQGRSSIAVGAVISVHRGRRGYKQIRGGVERGAGKIHY